MSLRRQRQMLRLSELVVDTPTRKKLVEGILRRTQRTVKLYAWKVNPSDNLAEQAFFTQRAALVDWYATKRVWEEAVPPKGVVIHEWSVCVDDIISHIESGCVRNIPRGEKLAIRVATLPSDLHGDIQQVLK